MHACDLNLCTDLHCPRRILTLAAACSCAVTSSTNAFNGVGCHHAPLLPRSNPHSAPGTTACHFPRFRSLEAFGRRPQPRCSRPRPSSAGIRNPSHGLPCRRRVGDGRSAFNSRRSRAAMRDFQLNPNFRTNPSGASTDGSCQFLTHAPQQTACWHAGSCYISTIMSSLARS